MSRLPLSNRVCRWLAALVLSLAPVAAGCGGPAAIIANHAPVELAAHATGVSWFGPPVAADLSHLGRWRRGVGPPLVMTASALPAVADRLVVVNWNVHVGAGDVARLVDDIRRDMVRDVPIVLLLQEAYRRGPDVPHSLDSSARFAPAIRALRQDGHREPIESVAAALGLHAYYVPSMRNGGPGVSDEDRGNAILSTARLTDLHAIELPFEKQRRVAVAATVGGSTTAGAPWRLRVVSAHLDNVGTARRLWIAGSEFGRARQARGLVAALDGDTSMVLGADLNSWFGFRDAAYQTAARAFPHTRVTDRRSTFRGLLRLDHLFFRLDQGWTASFRRADRAYGSDHHPLIGIVEFAR